MRIAVFGTGMVGQTLASRLAGLGHDVTVGTRDPASSLARTDADERGTPGFGTWAQQHPDIGVAAYGEAARDAELVVNATSGEGALEALEEAVADLEGTVVLDVSNPLDFSGGFPPLLSVCNDDSLGEELQRAFPQARVVKSLNTMNASVMADPASVGGGDHSVFVCGDDAEAKQVVAGLLGELGHRDVIDLGDITNARGVEMWLPLWVRLASALGTASFQLKIVR